MERLSDERLMEISAIDGSNFVPDVFMPDPSEAVAMARELLELRAMADPPKPAMSTVKVRIAAAVDSDGGWSASGWMGATDDAMGIARDAVGDRSAGYWITADLPVPEAVEIKGEVEVEG